LAIGSTLTSALITASFVINTAINQKPTPTYTLANPTALSLPTPSRDPSPYQIVPQRPTQSPTESPVPTTGPREKDQPAATVETSSAPATTPPTTTRRVEPAASPPIAQQTSDNGLCRGLGVEDQVVRACNMIVDNVSGIDVIGGYGLRPSNPTSCHPQGLALDLMTYDDMDLGDRIYSYILNNKESLGATTVLWRVAAHYDHVHVSFDPCYR
jgi:hypothetical protein